MKPNVTLCSQENRESYGELYWTPAPLLEDLANSGKTFDQWSAGRT